MNKKLENVKKLIFNFYKKSHVLLRLKISGLIKSSENVRNHEKWAFYLPH